MRRIVLTISIILSVSLLLAQHKGPYMSFSETVYDFGKIKQENGPVRHTFEFINTGSQPVIIKEVKTSCGCTTPQWTKRPIPPGTKGQITVEFDPRNRPGNFQKTITVYSNAKNSPVKLIIKGVVEEKANPIVEKYPFDFGNGLRVSKRFINFGPILKNKAKTKTIKIYNYSDQPITIRPMYRRLPPHIKVEIQPEQIPPKSEATMTITFDATKAHDWDYVRSRILFNINGKPMLNKWVDVAAIVKENFSPEIIANPPIIKFDHTEYDFGTIKQGQVIEHTFKFTNVGKSPLLIRKVKTSCGCTTSYYTRDTIKPGEQGEIRVKFNSAHKRGKQIKTITVLTNSPKTTKVILKLTGTVTVENKPQKPKN